jgi:membrane fusion protein (multidrug efflux system)
MTPGENPNENQTATGATAPVAAEPIGNPRETGTRRWIVVGVLVVGLSIAAIVGVPRILYAWSHVSTDDAIVNSHVTYLSSRIDGVAMQVLVDDNEYVEAGQALVRVDDELFQLAVQQKQAALARAKLSVDQAVAALQVARADLEQARTQARSQFAGLRSSWYLVQTIQDLVRYQTAGLKWGAANLRQQQASERLAEVQYERVKSLDPKTVGQEEIDQRQAALQVAHEQTSAAWQSIQQTRALLGLPADAQDPSATPANVGETFSGTQYAVASAQQALAQIGVRFDAPSPSLAALHERLATLVVDQIVEQSPAVAAAKARVAQAQAALGGSAFDAAQPYANQPAVAEAQKELEEAQLRLRYMQIVAPISGFVNRRNVNPGTHVQAGQALLAIRPLKDVWVEANFKETQLRDLMVGQAVELHVDAYPGRTFKGRIAGFSPGTGSVQSILPPENATGNFVKVVQRLAVRIELTEPNPKQTPLFAGLSVVPEVDIRSTPSGPDAGERLLTAAHPPRAAAPPEAAVMDAAIETGR